MKQTNEEIANAATHFLGVGMAVTAGWILIGKSLTGGSASLFASIVFSVSVLLMYTASTLYHWTLPGRGKRLLRYVDHINIYVLIAASYTPILLCAIGGKLGWGMFAMLWTLVLGGALYKISFLGKYPRLSLIIYLVMGWSVVLIAKSVWLNMPALALGLILLEGILYTVGTYFYSRDTKRAYYHAIWHLFVLGGTASHAAAVWLILV